MTRWEYKVVGTSWPLPDYILNDHGRDGWELVAITLGPVGWDNISYRMTFKRPLPAE